MPEKALRVCAGCQQYDTDPRHGFAARGGQTPPLPWHMDCHVLATGCQICTEQLELCDTTPDNDGVKGDELQKRLVALRTDNTQED